ncbi:MAG: hypothetical protein ACRD4I_05860, partial [Candidatus Angelobacter sp.]
MPLAVRARVVSVADHRGGDGAGRRREGVCRVIFFRDGLSSSQQKLTDCVAAPVWLGAGEVFCSRL